MKNNLSLYKSSKLSRRSILKGAAGVAALATPVGAMLQGFQGGGNEG